MITGHYVAMTHYDRHMDGDFVTFLLGPFPDNVSMLAAGEKFVPWFNGKYPGSGERKIEPCAYTAARLPLGRCNAEYKFDPFPDGVMPPTFRK